MLVIFEKVTLYKNTITDMSHEFLAIGSKNHKEYVALMECASGEGQY